MKEICPHCGLDRLEVARLASGELGDAAPGVRARVEACGACRALDGELRRLDELVVEAVRETAPPWIEEDGRVFLARFRSRRDAGQASEFWRFLALRLWPVSAGLLIGAVIALGAADGDVTIDFEGDTLAFERATAESEEADLLADVLAPSLMPEIPEDER